MTTRDFKHALIATLIVMLFPLSVLAQDVPGVQAITQTLQSINLGKSALDVVQAVPTNDTRQEAKETGISILGVHIPISWNQLAITVAKTVLNQIIDSTVNWMNSGFDANHSPAFVTDPKAYFGDLANGIVGDFIKDSRLGFLCSPLQTANLRLSLQEYYTQSYQPQCTLTGIKGNIDDFYNHFTSGGWDTFIQLTQVPDNNPYGSYVNARVEIDNQIATAIGVEKSKLDWGQGFKSQGDCLKYNIAPNNGTVNIGGIVSPAPSSIPDPSKPPGACLQYGPVKTPGATIKAHLDEALPANNLIRQITTADQFDKLLTALGNGLLRRFVFGNGGLLGKSSGGSSGSNPGGSTGPAPTFQCSASPDVGVMGQTNISWSAYSTVQDKAISYTWTGDDGLSGTGDTITHTYNQFGVMNATAHASTTDLDDLGNYIPGTEKTVDVPCSSVRINQYPPLQVVDCRPSAPTVQANGTITWTAKISGGSGNLSGYVWGGGQGDVPGCSGTNVPCSIWAPFVSPVPTFPYTYFSDLKGGSVAGVTLYTLTKNSDSTITLTAAREYFGNYQGHTGVKVGDTEDANLSVYDKDANTLPINNASCGTVTIVP